MSTVVASYGAGVNSTAMLIGCAERGEVPDLILFSDTGGERPETYEYLRAFSEWLRAHRMPQITIVCSKLGTLEDECLRRRTLPSIVVGIRSCSDKYKLRPQKAYLRAWAPAVECWRRGEKVTRLIGFDAGEPWRRRESESKHYVNRFPLIEWGWARQECIDTIQASGLDVPRKSSCFFCPEMREREIAALKEDHPELFERARAMERNNSSLTSVRGLARKYDWGQVIEARERQQNIFLTPGNFPCMCYDGAEDE